MMKNCFRVLAFVFIFSPAFVDDTRADFLSTFGPQTYFLPSHPDGITVFTDTRNATLSFPRHDPSLGVLNSVTVSFASTATASLTGTQSNPSSTNFTNGNMRVRYTLTGPSISIANEDIFFNSTVAAPGTGILINYGQLTSGMTSTTSTSSLSSFIGTGSINLGLRMDFLQNAFASSASLTYNFTTTTATTAQVIYNFTPIPEPSSISLLAPFVALAGFRIRMRTRP